MVNGYPWGDLDGFADSRGLPDTGITRHYTFHVARGRAAPDGYQKDMLLINDAFPGPLIEANWGDWISGWSHVMNPLGLGGSHNGRANLTQ